MNPSQEEIIHQDPNADSVEVTETSMASYFEELQEYLNESYLRLDNIVKGYFNNISTLFNDTAQEINDYQEQSFSNSFELLNLVIEKHNQSEVATAKLQQIQQSLCALE